MASSRGMVSGARAAAHRRAMAFLFFFLLLLLVGVGGQLQVGFYSDSCPDAEDTVTAAVQDAAANDPTILPALLRLQFHDCFVKVRTTCMRASDPSSCPSPAGHVTYVLLHLILRVRVLARRWPAARQCKT